MDRRKKARQVLRELRKIKVRTEAGDRLGCKECLLMLLPRTQVQLSAPT